MLGEEGRTRSWDRSHRGTKVRDLKLSTVWKTDAEGQGWGEPRGSGGPRGSEAFLGQASVVSQRVPRRAHAPFQPGNGIKETSGNVSFPEKNEGDPPGPLTQSPQPSYCGALNTGIATFRGSPHQALY